MSRPQQQVTLLDLGAEPLSTLLGLTDPPFLFEGEALRQLLYIDRFIRALGCRTLLIEKHYIDRHYMEDHSVFYSRNLYPFQNFCRRLHFFTCPKDELSSGLAKLRTLAKSLSGSEHRSRCESFSDQFYLGFSVIKPLPGCPVGRTVLRPGPEAGEDGSHRRFACTRQYTVHLCGLSLTVRGLAFQQQDVGVSACATTALWSALQKFQDFEDIGSATPAQITTLASQFTLPFGRSMPSEGLSLDQMCQAVRALGVAPNLFSTDDFQTARSYLHSAVSSELATILILSASWDERLYHAVVAVGMEVQDAPASVGFALDRAGDLSKLFVHDDRIGPYVPAAIQGKSKDLLVTLGTEPEPWRLEHILIPMHTKVRLSFPGLRQVAFRLLEAAQAFRETVLGLTSKKSGRLTFDLRIMPSHLYLKELLVREGAASEQAERLWNEVPLPRYVGIVRLEAATLDPIHFLVDCTSTERNIHTLAVLALGDELPETPHMVRFLADRYDSYRID